MTIAFPKIIQGGMGVAISDWKLAQAVAKEGPDFLGVVSGTAIAVIMAGRLSHGDPGGHIRRALSHFPFQEPVKRILDRYFVPGGIDEDKPFKRPPMWTMKPTRSLHEVTVIANFVEVFLAREGHNNPIGVNLLEKVQLPNMASLYGAMLANVAVVIIGAGIPIQIPGILDKLAEHQPVSYRIDVLEAEAGDDFRIAFDPEEVFPGIAEKVGKLTRPMFFPIIMSHVLAKALVKRSTGKIDGWVIEQPSGGGHNAPPRGRLKLDDGGEPIYGEKDSVDIEKLKEFGLPFWIGGGYGHPDKLVEALALGAAGIQVGTMFAYCRESGLEADIKRTLIAKALRGEAYVRTDPIASPTGFPFKVVKLEGSVSDPQVYEKRGRICDLGYLRHNYKREDGKIGFRCTAEPLDDYERKGGSVDDTVGRSCLCNNLVATAGFGQRRGNNVVEPPVVTSGKVFEQMHEFIKPGKEDYTARDVLDYLMQEIPDPALAEKIHP